MGIPWLVLSAVFSFLYPFLMFFTNLGTMDSLQATLTVLLFVIFLAMILLRYQRLKGVLTVLLLLPMFLDALACVLVRDGGLSLVF